MSFSYSHFSQALVRVYSDLLGFYVKVRGLFLNKEGKASCECLTVDLSQINNDSLPLFCQIHKDLSFSLDVLGNHLKNSSSQLRTVS